MKRLLLVVTFMFLLVQAYALPINSPVPSNAYIVFAGLDWAWGGPCPYSGGCFATGDLTYQSTQGWRLPTAGELALIPSNFASDFITGSGNVPFERGRPGERCVLCSRTRCPRPVRVLREPLFRYRRGLVRFW